MGTHPIFESDFDCLTECFETSTIHLLPHGPLRDVSTRSNMRWKLSNKEVLQLESSRKLMPYSLPSSAHKMNCLPTSKSAFELPHIVECLWLVFNENKRPPSILF